MPSRDLRLISKLHRLVYQATGGVIGGRLVRNDMLLLTTTGRRSGRPHTVPLLYLREGDRHVVIASYGGRDHHPAWYLNLLADPVVTVRIGSREFPARASTADPAERARWWPRVVSAYRGYAAYQEKTARQVPIVFLDRQEAAPAR